MTKLVLLFGLLGVALFTLIWLVFTVLPTLSDTGVPGFDNILQTLRLFAEINRYNDPTPFTRTALFFQLWSVCFVIAIVSDIFVRPAAKAVVSAFAAPLSPEAGQVANVTQHYDWRATLRTTTSGSFRGRPTTVLVFQAPRMSFLMVKMACRALWSLDIRKRNLASEAFAWIGAPLDEIGDDALDKAVVIQGDDQPAIRKWLASGGVQPRILSLFQVCGTTSLTIEAGSEGELRAYYARFRPRFFQPAHAVCILDDLAVLAASAEAGMSVTCTQPGNKRASRSYSP